MEIWDLYDGSGIRTGKTMCRGEPVPAGYYHLCVHIWPINSKGELLVQRRAPSVMWNPNRWAVTGGSAMVGESVLEAAIRELREEIGYAATVGEMEQIAFLKRSNSYCGVYMAAIDLPESAFVLQKEEVSAVCWCSPERIREMLSCGMLYNYGEAYYRMLFDYMKTRGESPAG